MDVWMSEILAWMVEPAAGWAPMRDWAQPMGLNQLTIVQEYAWEIEGRFGRGAFGFSSLPRAVFP